MASSQAMADLFALQRIHADVLFRNDDYVAAEKAKAIGRLLEQLRRVVREQAVPLVDAWNLPVRLLGFFFGFGPAPGFWALLLVDAWNTLVQKLGCTTVHACHIVLVCLC